MYSNRIIPLIERTSLKLEATLCLITQSWIAYTSLAFVRHTFTRTMCVKERKICGCCYAPRRIRPMCSLSTSTLCCVQLRHLQLSVGDDTTKMFLLLLLLFYLYFLSLLGAPTDHICNHDETVGMLEFLFEDQIFIINACFFSFTTKNPLEKLSFPLMVRPRTPNEIYVSLSISYMRKQIKQ